MTAVTIVTHRAYADGTPDDHSLAAAIEARGGTAHFAVWDDETVDWSATPLAVVRSTWDYHLHPTRWFAWIDRAGARTRLVNAAATLTWNSDKAYLAELERSGLATVPTLLLGPTDIPDLARRADERGWRDVVIKPSISAGARGARRFSDDAIAGEGVDHAQAIAADARVLVQPFLGEVEASRERSLVFIGGAFRYAFTKPAFSNGLAEVTAALELHEASDREIALGQRAIAAAPQPPLFARVDMVPTAEGPLLMELELIEPMLAFHFDPSAADALAALLLDEGLADAA